MAPNRKQMKAMCPIFALRCKYDVAMNRRLDYRIAVWWDYHDHYGDDYMPDKDHGTKYNRQAFWDSEAGGA